MVASKPYLKLDWSPTPLSYTGTKTWYDPNSQWLYLDDTRELPSHYDVLVKSVGEAKEWLSNPENLKTLEGISFDWDLGIGYEMGDKLSQYCLEETLAGRFPQLRYRAHTSSDYGREIIHGHIRKMNAYWKDKEES